MQNEVLKFIDEHILSDAIHSMADYICASCRGMNDEEIANLLSDISEKCANTVRTEAESLAAKFLLGDDDPEN